MQNETKLALSQHPLSCSCDEVKELEHCNLFHCECNYGYDYFTIRDREGKRLQNFTTSERKKAEDCALDYDYKARERVAYMAKDKKEITLEYLDRRFAEMRKIYYPDEQTNK